MEEKIRAHIVVSGRVQGVLFRKHAQQEARVLGLGGWAHNRIDGKVEILCEGEKERVEEFIEWCKKGPPLAKVESVEVEHKDHKDEFRDFEIREFGF